MSAKLALLTLFDAVSARFASEAGKVSTIATSDYAGTSSPSLSGSPLDAVEARVRFDAGGAVGTAGIVYRVSLDAGTTWSDPTDLDDATTIVLSGVTLTLGAGTVVEDDELRWRTTSPVNPPHVFGWRQPTHRSGAFRVVWVPGDDGDVGELAPVQRPGRNPRALATLKELFTVYLEARDARAPQNESAQYEAAIRLFHAWWRAAFLEAQTVISIERMEWVPVGPVLGAVSQAGATMRVVCSLESVMPDLPFATASTRTTAEVSAQAVINDDETDQVDVETVEGESP